MPHVSVKMYPGRSEKEKAELAEAIMQDVMDIIGAGRSSISVAIEEISPQEWKEKKPSWRKQSCRMSWTS